MAATAPSGFYMARQPIYSRQLKLVGYELLYRRNLEAGGSEMTAEDELHALANILVEVGLDRLAGDRLAYINVPQGLLGSDALRLLPPDRVTLEILENTEWNDEVAHQVKGLRDSGYNLALDDYIFEDRHEPFLSQVQVVKVDVLDTPLDVLKQRIPLLKSRGLTLLAEKVETHEMVETCRQLGFDLFQGYFLSKPNTIQGTGVRANFGLSMSLLARLQNPDITMDELEVLIIGNVALCHKVLRLVNSAAMGLTRPVESIKQALMFLGTSRIRTLASLAVMTSIPGKPPELYSLAMIRARFCESLAKSAQFDTPEKHFTVGLLSVLDALTDAPMTELIAELPLSDDISEALVDMRLKAPCSHTLQHVLRLEQGDWHAARNAVDVDSSVAYLEAVHWAQEQERSLAAA